jgi:DUF971 family protein
MTDEFRNREDLTPEQIQPTGLDLDVQQQELRITWADGVQSTFSAAMLRKNCPCATCRTEREKQSKAVLPILSQSSSGPITITGGHLVGSYALQIEWSDGHNTGIYDFRLLRAFHESGRI